jgi:hypothetical protein
VLLWLLSAGPAINLAPDGYHVHPGDNIQDALLILSKLFTVAACC